MLLDVARLGKIGGDRVVAVIPWEHEVSVVLVSFAMAVLTRVDGCKDKIWVWNWSGGGTGRRTGSGLWFAGWSGARGVLIYRRRTGVRGAGDLAQDFLVAFVDLGFDLVEARHGRNVSVRGKEGEHGVDVGNVQDTEEAVLNDLVGAESGRELEELDDEFEDADDPLNGSELLWGAWGAVRGTVQGVALRGRHSQMIPK